MPTDETLPALASSENFDVYQDEEGGAVVLVFNTNAVTVAIDREDFDEFARVIAEAAKNLDRK